MFPRIIALMLVTSAALTACAVDEEDEGSFCRGYYVVEDVDPAGIRSAWVVDSITLPQSAAQATQLGTDINGDEHQRPDNALGQILAAVYGNFQGDIDGPLQTMIDDGRLLHVLELQAASLENAHGAGVTVWIATDQDGDPSDNFSGSEIFGIDSSEASYPMRGTIEGGVIRVRLGEMPLQLAMPGVDTPSIVHLDAATLEATIDGDRLTGKLGGVIREEAVANELLVMVQRAAEYTIARDCTEQACEPGSAGEWYRGLFDEDGDGQVTLTELQENSLVRSLTAPDVDMLDEDGYLSCTGDGIKDSLSVGIGFTAVRARLSP